MGTAQLAFGTGVVTIPVDTPYDRQEFIEDVLKSVRKWGKVQVQLDHAPWTVESLRVDGIVCRGCSNPISRVICRRRGMSSTTGFCIDCALVRPLLTARVLRQLPPGTILRDVQAQAAYGNEWVMWMRWPQATPTEILDDMRLQRRFTPVLRFRCAKIDVEQGAAPLAKGSTAHRRRSLGGNRS